MLKFKNREALIEYLDRHVGAKDSLTIYQLCGQVVKFRVRDDIPEGDMPCPCGDKNCWVFQYTESGG